MSAKDWYWVFSLVSIVAAVFNIKKKKVCFLIWTVSNIGFITINVLTQTYGQLFLWIAFLILSIYGYIRWRKGEMSEEIRDRLRKILLRERGLG